MVSMQIAALMMALSGAGETVLLDFSAPWCAPCRSMEGTIAELEQAGYPVRKVDVDRERSVATQYSVQSIPCFVLLVDGREAGRVTGAVRRAELLALFAKSGIGPQALPATIARGQSPDPARGGVALPAEMNHNPLSRSHVAQPSAGELASAPSRPAASAGPQDLIQASVRLTIQDPKGYSYGSGTLIDSRQGEALVLTCGHIFRDSQGQGTITVDMFGPQAPQKLPGRLISFDLTNDVALVSIRPGVPVSVAPVAPKGTRIVRGDKVTTVGCNNGGPATVLESQVNGVNKFAGPPNVQVAGVPVQGRSGGGLFNAQGMVIGVCNAADPADQEGMYAALATIQAELDEAGLSALYQNRPLVSEPGLAAADGQRAAMPGAMPQFASTRGASLNDAERAAVSEMQSQGDGAEVICIVRSLANPQAKSEVIALDRASPALLKQLAADQQAQQARHLTSLQVRPRATQNRPTAEGRIEVSDSQTTSSARPWR